MWQRVIPGRSALSVGSVMVGLCSMLGFAAWGHTSPELDARNLTDPTVWVSTSSAGLVHPIDGTVGRAGPSMTLEGAAGDKLTTVQSGANGYVLNETERTVRYIDAARRQFSPVWQEPGNKPDEPAEGKGKLSFFAGESIAWAYSSVNDLLYRLSPGVELADFGQPIPLLADGDDAVMLPGGDLAAPRESEGEIVRVTTDGSLRSTVVASPGDDLVVRLIDETVVVVDRTTRELIVLDEDLQPKGQRCSIQAEGAPEPASGRGEGGRLAALMPDHKVMVTDLESCREAPVTIDGGTDLGTPLVSGTRVYVPDYTEGVVHIIDISGFPTEAMPVLSTPVPGVTGEFELLADDGMVIYNDPQSSAAGAVLPDGTIVDASKFETGPDGRPVPSKNPSSPTATDPTGGEGEDASSLQCDSDPPQAAVGQLVTFTASQELGADDEPVASWQFLLEGDTKPTEDDDGLLARTFDQPGPVKMSVRGVLATGGITKSVSCGEVTIGDGQVLSVRCQSSVGRSAGIDKEITFSASSIPGDAWKWTFSDGGTSTDASPKHSFHDAGPAWAQIEVTTTSGVLKDRCDLTVTAGAADLSPSFTVEPQQVVVGKPVRFVSTTPNEAEIASYTWTFEGAEPATATGPDVGDVVWQDAGSRKVTLAVTNSAGKRVTKEQKVEVKPPQAYEPIDIRIAPIGSTVTTTTIDLRFSTLKGSAASATWTIVLANETDAPTTVARLSGFSQAYAIPDHAGGTYTVTVEVKDDQGATDTDSTTFNAVRPLNPQIDVDKTTVAVGETVNFTGTSPNPNVATWDWNYGDGGTGQGKTASHAFTSAGTMVVKLTVGLKGATATTTKQVVVSDASALTLVPKVIGLTEAAAGTLLTANQLKVGSVSRGCQAGVPSGQVFDQGPREGDRVVKSSAVDLSVSDGTHWTVPDIAPGQTGASLGLSGTLTVNEVPQTTTDRSLDGKKISQSPPPGTALCGQATVDIVRGVYVDVPVEFTCGSTSIKYGGSVTCTAKNNSNGGSVNWGDGSAAESIAPGGSASHTYRRVGSSTPALTHDGKTIPAAAISIGPDINVNCDGSASSKTTSCTPGSNALGDLGGTVTWSISGVTLYGNSGYTGSGNYPGSSEGGWSPSVFMQATITFTVSVNGVTVTDAHAVYLAGCG